jgi:group I intron endonuclease
MKKIYIITNTVTGRRYVGRTKDVSVRFDQHLRRLRGGYHHNSMMQMDFNLYGAGSFEIEYYCDGDSKLETQLARQMEYNVIGKSLSDSTKSKMAAARMGKPSARKGRKNSKEMNEKISKSLIGNQRARKNKLNYINED